MMSNYLTEIENEYSRGRGKSSRLSPIDWQLAESWERGGIPLRIALAAMGEGFKKFAAQNRKDEISSLKYFIPMINKQFAEWQTSQVGKSPETPIFRKTNFEEENDMRNSALAAMTAIIDENVETLDSLATALLAENFQRHNITLPEPLCCTVVVIRGEILALLDDVKQKQLLSGEVESRLIELRTQLEIALIASVSDDERARLIKETKAEYGKFTLMPEVEHKVLIRKLYRKFELPELTLFAL